MSALEVKADITVHGQNVPLVTQSGHFNHIPECHLLGGIVDMMPTADDVGGEYYRPFGVITGIEHGGRR
jgi:hypothetical protein